MTETWILYQTTNLLSGKIYVGVHKLADTARSRQYLGSGQAIKVAIKKYGRDNFIRTTLAEFKSGRDAYAAEAELVDEEFTKRQDTYNISLGGRSVEPTVEMREKIGAAHRGKVLSEETKAKIIAANTGKKRSAEFREKISAIRKNSLGRAVSEETRAKLSAANKDKREGAKNHKSKPVKINEIYYESANLAAKAEKLCCQTILNRIKSGYKGYFYATKRENEIIGVGI